MSEQDQSSRRGPGRDAMAERARRLVGEAAQLLTQQRPGEAVPLLIKARELDPLNAAAAINLGGAYILQGKYKQAAPILEEAARLEPDNPMVWTNLAAAYLGRLPFATTAMQDKAIAAFERALELDPRAPHAHYDLGLIYIERHDVEQAALHFYAALETNPNDRDAEVWLGRIRRGEAGKTAPPES